VANDGEMIIRNRSELLSHGNAEGRRIALDILEGALETTDACYLVKALVLRDANRLEVGPLTFDLSSVRDVYVLGGGKAVLQMAEALDDILGDRIHTGIVVEKKLNGMTKGLERISRIKRIEVLQANHPIPDPVAVAGARKILEAAQNANHGDLVFFCVQGGCTCLTTLPADGLTLEDIEKTTELLLNSGLEIRIINTVRAAMTKLSQGRLARYIHPAQLINLVINDYVWGYPEGWGQGGYALGWGPSVPVPEARRSAFEANILAIQKHPLWRKMPQKVKEHLQHLSRDQFPQTVKDFEKCGINFHTFILASPEDAAEAAEKAASKINIPSLILSSAIEGEAGEVGIVLVGIAKEIVKRGRPLKPPCTIIAAGEKTVTIPRKHGEGGRNQEAVLSAASKIDGGHEIVILSVGTDGTDGPTDVAGGIVDGYTAERARRKGISISDCLKMHDSTQALKRLNDAIFFNQPGNNLCDLSLIIVTA
jgi:glycerate 2-kinase